MKGPAPVPRPDPDRKGRSATHGRILARVLVDPDARYGLTDIAGWSGTSVPTVQREIDRAEQAGIVAIEKVDPTRLVRANHAHPLYGAVRRLILANAGPPAVVAEEFASTDGAETVLLFGSAAARYCGEPGRGANDIDVLVIGKPGRDAIDAAERAERAERRIGLPVQATVRTRTQWEAKARELHQGDRRATSRHRPRNPMRSPFAANGGLRCSCERRQGLDCRRDRADGS